MKTPRYDKAQARASTLTCILCEHYSFYGGMLDYSDSLAAQARCAKEHWDVDLQDDTEDDYRRALMSAPNCPDFSRAEVPE